MDEFYYYDGEATTGPHSLREIQEIYALGMITSRTPVVQTGDREWKTLGAYCDLNAPECQPLELDFDEQTASAELGAVLESPSTESPAEEQPALPAVATATVEEQQESIREDEEEMKQHRTTRHQLLRQIRAELDQLWEAQRESIIARIRYEPLDKAYEATRKRNREIYRVIEENAMEYWRRTGLLVYWIREMTWREHDFTFRLRGKTEADKYASLQAWLEESRLADFAGCYCFKNGRDYMYIGQAGVLRDRIKQHEKKTYFTYANAVRVVIPKNKRQLNQLERLLILAHSPNENSNCGVTGKTPVDDCLEFIRGEIKELITDF
jgi:hypothetical protein